MRRFFYLGLAALSLFFQDCSPNKDANVLKPTPDGSFYSMADFDHVEKYDSHVHLNMLDTSFIKQAEADHFRLLTINVAAPYFPGITQQQGVAQALIKAYPDRLAYSTTFSLKDWGTPQWQQQTLAYLDDSFKHGAVAVKVWKNIGMHLKDNNGKYVFIDDPSFDPILNFIEQNHIPLIAHSGEPKDAWLPLDSMTVASDRKYYSQHPEYHMYYHPERPSYDDQIRARDNMLKKHPNLMVIGAHLGSLEWDVDQLASRLDQFPNFAADMAARVVHLEYQSLSNRQKVRDFMIKYQDRLIYGSDEALNGNVDVVALNKSLHESRIHDWQFFATADAMTSKDFAGTFTGLQLPKQVIDKIYHDNAKKWFVKLP